MSLILHIETATKICSVCLSKEGQLIHVIEEYSEKYIHAEKLTVLIEQLMHDTNYNLKDLDAISIDKGPGSFTGLRIGVSTAKGLCYSLQIPLLAVDSLTALYFGYKKIKGAISENELVIPMIDARRMEVYTAAYNYLGEYHFEIDAKVIEVSKKYFYLQESNRYRVFEEDGRVFIQKRKGQELYDWVILDAFKSGSIPYHLKTHEFYKEIRAILKPDGIVGSNLYGKGNTLKPRDTKTFMSVFPNIYCFEDEERVATVLIANGGERWNEEKIKDRASIFSGMPEPFSMKEVAKAYRPGKFIEESIARFDDHFSEKGFLHDVEKENRSSAKTRRYPIKNVH